MNRLRNIAIGVALSAAFSLHSSVTVYPAGKDVPTLNEYTISVRQAGSADWLPVDAYPVRL